MTSIRSVFLLYVISVAVMGTAVSLFSYLNIEKLQNDFWFEQYCFNLLEGDPVILWGNGPGSDLNTANNVQRGVYYNWRSIGYSLFLVPPALADSAAYEIIRTVYQLFVYAWIPPIVYLLSLSFFHPQQNKQKLAMIAATVFLLNPSFLVSPLQVLDTWLITFFSILGLYALLKTIDDRSWIHYSMISAAAAALFLTKPITVIPFLIVLPLMAASQRSDRVTRKKTFVTFSIICVVILLWGLRNYVYFQVFDFSNSSAGYNAWLGNNPYTNEFLRDHWGDGASIEDNILLRFNDAYSFLKDYSEYEKNDFLLKEAVHFALHHPLTTAENMFWKFVGFWSPLRMRAGHWTDSTLKMTVTLIYTTPIIILSCLSVIQYIFKEKKNRDQKKTLLLLYMALWMLPHLFFFSSARFRTPIEFGLILLSVSYLNSIFRLDQLSGQKAHSHPST